MKAFPRENRAGFKKKKKKKTFLCSARGVDFTALREAWGNGSTAHCFTLRGEKKAIRAELPVHRSDRIRDPTTFPAWGTSCAFSLGSARVMKGK